MSGRVYADTELARMRKMRADIEAMKRARADACATCRGDGEVAWLVESGMILERVAGMLRHTTTKLAESTYARLRGERLSKLLAKGDAAE